MFAKCQVVGVEIYIVTDMLLYACLTCDFCGEMDCVFFLKGTGCFASYFWPFFVVDVTTLQ